MLVLPFRRKLHWRGFTITPGSAAYTSPGTYYFTVPYYSSLTVDVRGAGGGGGGSRYTGYAIYYGGNGGYSYFAAPDAALWGDGGAGGSGTNWNPPVGGVNGAHGSGANGDTNITGGGSAGGEGSIISLSGSLTAGQGGWGGRAVRTWSRSQWYTKLTPRSVITIVVGTGGAAAECEPVGIARYPARGQHGAVYISWS